MRSRVNYDDVADGYNRRFDASPMEKIGAALKNLVEEGTAKIILEAGCGTGHWLEQLSGAGRLVLGVDPSMGMLREARKGGAAVCVQRGMAENLPFASGSVDLVYVVNALHHIEDRKGFIVEAARVLREDGVLAVIGSDPHDPGYRWYVHDWFDGVLEFDLERFPAWDELRVWMDSAGFKDICFSNLDVIKENHRGRQVFESPFIEKESVSQLALLSEQEYQAGLKAMLDTVQQAEGNGEVINFPVVMPVQMVAGRFGFEKPQQG